MLAPFFIAKNIAKAVPSLHPLCMASVLGTTNKGDAARSNRIGAPQVSRRNLLASSGGYGADILAGRGLECPPIEKIDPSRKRPSGSAREGQLGLPGIR